MYTINTVILAMTTITVGTRALKFTVLVLDRFRSTMRTANSDRCCLSTEGDRHRQNPVEHNYKYGNAGAHSPVLCITLQRLTVCSQLKHILCHLPAFKLLLYI